ncbi:MAG: recombinase [Candidatus Methanoperedenaceae archaeon]|nr:MAG: recombinase [Candidatus Methanoperedenaceae archaeon]
MDRIKTGIDELDKMIGGFPVGKTILVTGDAGSGKTIFGLQFANICCTEGKKTVYISTEECAEDLRQQGKSFGWDFGSHGKKGYLEFIELAGNRAMEIETSLDINLDSTKGNFNELLDQIPVDTKILIIDSLGNRTANLTPHEFRDRFDLLVYNLNNREITTLVILDSATSREFHDLALFSVYGAIQLLKKENPYTDRRERVMDIVKMRNTRTPIQLLTYEINANGIVISSPIDSSGID